MSVGSAVAAIMSLFMSRRRGYTPIDEEAAANASEKAALLPPETEEDDDDNAVYEKAYSDIRKSLTRKESFMESRQEKLRHLLLYEITKEGSTGYKRMSARGLLNDINLELASTTEDDEEGRSLQDEEDVKQIKMRDIR